MVVRDGDWLEEDMRKLSGSDKNILYLNRGGGFVDKCICQKLI